MDPSTEQLIRDYLNRAAVAARSSMGTDERSAFLARTRDWIERQCRGHGEESLADVGDVLATLGEPKALVARERARLAAARDGRGPAANSPSADLAAMDPSFASPPAIAPGTSPGAPGTGDNPAGSPGGRLLRFPGKARRNARQRSSQPSADAGPGTDQGAGPPLTPGQQAIQRRPVTARRKPAEILTEKPVARKAVVRPRGPQGRDSPALLPLKRDAASWQDPSAGAGSQRAAVPEAAEQAGTALAFVVEPPPGRQPRPIAAPKFHPVRDPAGGPVRDPAGGPLWNPAGGLASSRPRRRGPEQDAQNGPERGPERGPEQGPEPGPDGLPGDVPLPAGIPTAPRSGEQAAAGPAAVVRRAAVLARRHPLECAAVIVLGLGGLIYPPAWLAGAALALLSRLWDIKDKMTGLAVPAVLAIVGGAGLAMGSSHTSGGAYLHEAVTIGGYLIRAASVLGAAYLAWRVHRGQRQPATPPWRRQYQSGDRT